MTEIKHKAKTQSKGAHRFFGTELVWSTVGFFSLFIMLRNTEIAMDKISYGLWLCVKTVIPSLFPFMVISEIIVSCDAIRNILGRIFRPLGRLLGIRSESVGAVFLGFICGFPIGARCALFVYDRGIITKEELSRLLAFCNIPSSAFIISTVGVALFNDRSFGTTLYCLTLLSALCVGVIVNLLFGKSESQTDFEYSETIGNKEKTKRKGISVFTDAIGSSALAMLKICAFVTFFCAFVGVLEYMLSEFAVSQKISTLIFGFFELTGGVAHASECIGTAGKYLCAFIVGWSGMSVHLQLVSLCADRDISLRPYFWAKMSQGLLNVVFLTVYYFLRQIFA